MSIGDIRPTVKLDPSALKPSWPIVVAYLEQFKPWGTMALRLGILALIQDCVRDLALYNADAGQVERLRDLVDSLAHMPFNPVEPEPEVEG